MIAGAGGRDLADVLLGRRRTSCQTSALRPLVRVVVIGSERLCRHDVLRRRDRIFRIEIAGLEKTIAASRASKAPAATRHLTFPEGAEKQLHGHLT